MSYQKIEPGNERSKMDFATIKENFERAHYSIDQYGRICPGDMGMDWNSCTIGNGRRNIISFALKSENGVGETCLEGMVKNVGHGEYRMLITGGDGNIGGAQFPESYVIRSVAEAVEIASKLEIITTEILPPGELPAVMRGEPTGPGRNPDPQDIHSYKAFAAELLSQSRTIIVSKLNEDFGDYIVAETNQGWFIAYNKNYGEGLYIVDDFEKLLLDKRTLMDNKDAIRIRRDRRGDWKKRVKDFM